MPKTVTFSRYYLRMCTVTSITLLCLVLFYTIDTPRGYGAGYDTE